jgi:hypothetical protein
VAKKAFVANQKMKNEPNFRKAKMNITPALTNNYENALFRSTEKTNPISNSGRATQNAGQKMSNETNFRRS